MPLIKIHKDGEVFEGEVQPNTNLVVRAGIRQFPYPHLNYGCGMGKCAKCMCKVLSGGEALPEPNWKEKKMLGSRLDQGYRLACQLWVETDLELAQESASSTSAPPRARVATSSS